MIRANSQKEQATILNLTETEMESIRGGMGHGNYDQSTYWSGANERFSYRGGDRFTFRDSERNNSYRSNGQSC